MQADQREIILESLRKDTSPIDWMVWTDGSGHVDGFGGYGAVAMRVRLLGNTCIPIQRASAAICGTTVNRAEFTGLLEALQVIHTIEMGGRGQGASMYPVIPVRVRWFSDRENLVLGVATNPETGEAWYGRNVDQDLWARYDWYAKSIIVRPVHIERNSMAMQAKCDFIASHGRRAYIRWTKHQTKKKKWI